MKYRLVRIMKQKEDRHCVAVERMLAPDTES